MQQGVYHLGPSGQYSLVYLDSPRERLTACHAQQSSNLAVYQLTAFGNTSSQAQNNRVSKERSQ